MPTPAELGIAEGTKIFPPAGKFKPSGIYILRVAFAPHNPLHDAILIYGRYSGTLHSPGYEDPINLGEVYCFRHLVTLFETITDFNFFGCCGDTAEDWKQP
jgi:hypothetical protein